MKLSMFALPLVAAGLVLGGCSGHRYHDDDRAYDRSDTQNTTPPPPPAGMPDNNSNTPGPKYPPTGGTN